MQDVGKRLKLIREQWGKSARALSIELGLNPGAWGIYETGRSLPGAAVMASLAKRGVDLHWLLLGEGSPNSQGSDKGALQELVAKADIQQENRMRLGRLALLANSSTLMLKYEIMNTIASKVVSLEGIAEQLGLIVEDVAGPVLELLADGLLLDYNGSYAINADVTKVAAKNVSEKAQLTIAAVKFLVNDVSTEVDSHNAVLVHASAGVTDGAAFVQSVLETIREKARAPQQPPLEQVQFIFGAKIVQES